MCRGQRAAAGWVSYASKPTSPLVQRAAWGERVDELLPELYVSTEIGVKRGCYIILAEKYDMWDTSS
jgi:hypothetical protein